MNFQGRRGGKSVASELCVEKALDAGKIVLICSKNGVLLKKRKKHLTLIEELEPLSHDWTSIDEWPLGGD